VAAQPGRRALDSLDGLPEDWVVLHDVAWPGRPPATIDHVLVGPSGVFVVLVRGPRRSRGRGRARPDGATPVTPEPSPDVAEASSAAAAVAGRVPFVPRHHVHAVLCAGDSTAAPEPVGEVMVVGAAGLAATVLSHPGRLPSEHTRAMASVLRAELSPAVVPARSGARSGAGSARRTAARGAVAAAALALVAVVAQPQLVGGLTSAGEASGPAVSRTAGDSGVPGPSDADVDADTDVDTDVDTDADTAVSGLGAAQPRVTPEFGSDGGGGAAGETGGEADPAGDVETPGTSSGADGSGAAPGADVQEDGAQRSGPDQGVTAGPEPDDYRGLVRLLGPRDPAGMVRHVTGLVATGALPTLVGVRSTPAPGRVCLQDERRDVTMTVGEGGGSDVLMLGRGTCDRGVPLARLVGSPGAYTVDGDLRLARGVAALLAPR